MGAGRGHRLGWALQASGQMPGLPGSSVQGSEVSRGTGQQLSLRPPRGPLAGAAAEFSAARQALAWRLRESVVWVGKSGAGCGPR